MGILLTAASSEYLAVGSVPDATLPISMSCWFNKVNITAGHALMSAGNSGTLAYQTLFCGGSGASSHILCATDTSGSAVFAESSAAYTANTWHHAAGVWTSATSRSAYLDGSNKGNDNSNVVAAGLDRFRIGSTADSTPANYFDGIIAYATHWDVALDDDEVLALGQGAHPLSIRADGIVAYWPLSTLANLRDQVGDNNLAATGGATAESPPKCAMPVIEVPSLGSAAGVAKPWWYYNMLNRRRSA